MGFGLTNVLLGVNESFRTYTCREVSPLGVTTCKEGRGGDREEVAILGED